MLGVMEGGARLRGFTGQDQAEVRSLILAGLGEHWGFVDETLNPDLDDIAESYADGVTVVAEMNSRVVATGTVVRRADGVAEIVRMSVDPACRRQGLGAAIVKALVDTARAWGASSVILETSTAWREVIAFYLTCGFHIVREVEGAFGSDTWFELEI
jgi:GNAT superfamily N-acetyltransferase